MAPQNISGDLLCDIHQYLDGLAIVNNCLTSKSWNYSISGCRNVLPVVRLKSLCIHAYYTPDPDHIYIVNHGKIIKKFALEGLEARAYDFKNCYFDFILIDSKIGSEDNTLVWPHIFATISTTNQQPLLARALKISYPYTSHLDEFINLYGQAIKVQELVVYGEFTVMDHFLEALNYVDRNLKLCLKDWVLTSSESMLDFIRFLNGMGYKHEVVLEDFQIRQFYKEFYMLVGTREAEIGKKIDSKVVFKKTGRSHIREVEEYMKSYVGVQISSGHTEFPKAYIVKLEDRTLEFACNHETPSYMIRVFRE